MKLSAYLRVSTSEQANGQGLPIQEALIRESGHDIVAWYSDTTSGRKDLLDRPGLGMALDDLRNKRSRGIIVYRLDRLARDLIVQEQLLAEIRKLGGKLISCAQGEQPYIDDDDTDPSRKLIRQVLGAVSEYERAMIKLRMVAGARRKRLETGWSGSPVPYGYANDEGTLVPAPEEQRVISTMRSLHSQGRTIKEIAAYLNELGVPTRYSKHWHTESVRRTLRRAERVG